LLFNSELSLLETTWA